MLSMAVRVSAAPSPIRIALVTDTHINRDATGNGTQFKGHLDLAIADINAAKIDVVLISGDLTNNGSQAEIDDFKAQVKGFDAPVRVVPGNHDVGNKHTPGKNGGVTEDRVAAYETMMGASFWSERVVGLHVVGVNASLFGSGLPSEERQWALLGKELAGPSQDPTIVLLHYPPFVKTADEAAGQSVDIEPEPRMRLLGLCAKAHVSAILSGHLHHALRNEWNGIPLITSIPTSYSNPKQVDGEGWTLVTVAADGSVTAESRPIRD